MGNTIAPLFDLCFDCKLYLTKKDLNQAMLLLPGDILSPLSPPPTLSPFSILFHRSHRVHNFSLFFTVFHNFSQLFTVHNFFPNCSHFFTILNRFSPFSTSFNNLNLFQLYHRFPTFCISATIVSRTRDFYLWEKPYPNCFTQVFFLLFFGLLKVQYLNIIG